MIKQANVFPALLRCRLLAVFLVLLLGGMRASAQLQTAPPPPSSQGAGDAGYIVTFRAGTSQADRAASVRRAGAILRFNYRIVDAVAITANINAIAALQRDPSVLEIIPNRPVRAFQIGGESHRPGHGSGSTSGQIVPEGVKRVGLPNTGSNGEGIGVAIVDTGTDFLHADLDGNLAPMSQSQSFVATGVGPDCQDQNMHGTHVAGIVAAEDNTQDVIGVAPKAKLYCVRVLDRNGNGDDGTVMEGLDWIGAKATTLTPPIRVVNMSLGREGTRPDNPALEASVKALYDLGIVVVVAAGNDPSLEVPQNVPATYPWVFAVAATTAKDGAAGGICKSIRVKADTAAYFTTDGAFDPASKIGVTISAPGEDAENLTAAGIWCFINSVGILSTKLGGGTVRAAGTSMSSPHVAGVVARMMQAGHSDVESIRTLIRLGCSSASVGDGCADRIGQAPLGSPSTAYTDDLEREGIVKIKAP